MRFVDSSQNTSLNSKNLFNNYDNKNKSNVTCIPLEKKIENKKQGKLISYKKFLNCEINENTKGKYIDDKKFIKTDIFFVSKSYSIDPKIREKSYNYEKNNHNENNKTECNILKKRKSSRPDFIRNPFESQIINFH